MSSSSSKSIRLAPLSSSVNSLVELSVPFNFDDTKQSSKRFDMPFPPFNTGEWSFKFNPAIEAVQSDGYFSEDEYATVVVSCVGVTSFAKADAVELTAKGGATKNAKVVQGASFPPTRDWSVSLRYPSYFRGAACANLKVAFSSGIADAPALKQKKSAKISAVLLNSHSPNDVVFYFPRTKRELWINSDALKRASNYFATLLDSGFSETAAHARQSTADDGELDDVDEEDSDTETDTIALQGLSVRQNTSIPAGVKEIVIKDAAYTTYRALLNWTQCDFIEFAPLTAAPTALLTRKVALSLRKNKIVMAPESKSLPLPASPKSIYELARLLELPKLEKLALDNFKRQLSADNILHQLNTDIKKHEPVLAVMKAFAVEEWARPIPAVPAKRPATAFGPGSVPPGGKPVTPAAKKPSTYY